MLPLWVTVTEAEWKRAEKNIHDLINFEDVVAQDFHKESTPFILCAGIIDSIQYKLHDNAKVCVIANLEFVYMLIQYYRYYKLDISDIYFLTHNDDKAQLARNQGINVAKYDDYKNLNLKVFNVQFDVVLMNPPYKRGMHLLFTEQALSLLTCDGIMKVIQPATWIQNQVAGSNIAKYRAKLGPHISHVQYINGQDAFPSTELGMLISITTIDATISSTIVVQDDTQQTKYVVGDISAIHKFGILGNTISSKIISSIQASLRDNVHTTSIESPYYLTLPTMWGSMSDGTYDDNFFTFFGTGGEHGCNKHIRTELFEGATRIFLFNTLIEAENFQSYLKTYFARFCLSIAKFDRTINPITLSTTPYMDPKIKWTDEMLFDYFDITKEEQEFIYKHIVPYYKY
jgi:hypothetical protein